jgi:hypothetical protein
MELTPISKNEKESGKVGFSLSAVKNHAVLRCCQYWQLISDQTFQIKFKNNKY